MNRKLSVMTLLVVVAACLTGAYYVKFKWFAHSPRHPSPRVSAGTGSKPKPPAGSGEPTASSVDTPQGIYYRNKVIVLMYHEVVDKQKDDKALPTNKFKQQLILMKRNNFHWITMDQYRQFILNKAPVPENAVLMTFDDGYESYYTDTYPILKQFHVPATNFLIVNTIGNPKHIGIPKLTWEQVSEMHRNGYDFYNHTFDSHFYAPHDKRGALQLPALMAPMYLKKNNRVETKKEYIARVNTDLAKANQILAEKVGNKNNILAFPYGGYTKPLLNLCTKLGINITFTVKNGINGYGQRNGFRVNAGGVDDKPTALIQMMKQEGRMQEPRSDASRFLLKFGVFGTLILMIALMKLLANAWEDKHGRRLFR